MKIHWSLVPKSLMHLHSSLVTLSFLAVHTQNKWIDIEMFKTVIQTILGSTPRDNRYLPLIYYNHSTARLNPTETIDNISLTSTTYIHSFVGYWHHFKEFPVSGELPCRCLPLYFPLFFLLRLSLSLILSTPRAAHDVIHIHGFDFINNFLWPA